MNLLHALILGIVEGITEFLPVSSTAHLILASKLLQIPQTDFQKFFDVFIQSGAILAVIFLYFQYVLKHKKLQWNIFLSFVPTAIVGLVLYKVIKGVFFESTTLIAWALLILGIVFIVVENFIAKGKIKTEKTMLQISARDAILVGLAQSLAVIPGVSRAGIVMIAMLLLGHKRDESAVYSFLLAVPTLVAASAFDLYKSKDSLFLIHDSLFILFVGFVVSFITAYISVKWLMNYLKNHTLSPFGFYRIGLAIIVMLTLAR